MPSPSCRKRCAASTRSATRPPIRAKDGTFRKIEIKTGNKDWKVQARKGYYAIKTDNN